MEEESLCGRVDQVTAQQHKSQSQQNGGQFMPCTPCVTCFRITHECLRFGAFLQSKKNIYILQWLVM